MRTAVLCLCRLGLTVFTAESIDREIDFGFLREPAPFNFDCGEALLTKRLTGERKKGRRALARRNWGVDMMTAGTALGLRADFNVRIQSKVVQRVFVPCVENAYFSVSFANTFACLVGLRGAPPPLCG